MRSRNTIMKEWRDFRSSIQADKLSMFKLVLEVLLDIRDLLKEKNHAETE